MPSAPRPPEPERPVRALDFIDRLAVSGRYHFTTEEAAEALGLSEIAARAAVRRLKKRGVVAAPMRGFNVLVSPEHRAAGCPPPEQFLSELMEYLEAPYYVALLSAASFYDAVPAPPETFQVVTEKNRPDVLCGRVSVRFVARGDAASVPTRAFKTVRGEVRVSTPEATAIDLAGYPQHAGSLEDISLVLLGLAERIDPEALAETAALAAEMPWVQRLGYTLDSIGAASVTGPLADLIASESPVVTPLDPRLPWKGAPRDARWRVALNRE
jgi:predicted transcriptional regulator of viral defense system